MAEGFLDDSIWGYFWHPICTVAELEASDKGRGPILSRMLLGVELVIAKTPSGIVAFNNRCPHRSAKLSLGWVEEDSIRCPYHGWRYGVKDGMCLEIPAAPDRPIPPNARAIRYDCQVAYDLVWVRLNDEADTALPEHPVWNDPSFKCVLGPSYVWKTHSARRVENYTDLAHFPFVHPETLGQAGETTYLTPDINFRSEGKMRFRYVPSASARKAVDVTGNMSPLAYSEYTIRLPFGVTVDLTLQNGQRTVLWVWATPIDAIHCKSFWFSCRNGDLDGPDQPHIDMQLKILEEDIAVVESQDPEQIPHPRDEIAVAGDKVSLTYRKCLYDLCRAAKNSVAAINGYLVTDRDGI